MKKIMRIIEAIEEKLEAQEGKIALYEWQVKDLETKLAEAEKTINDLKGANK